MESRVILYPPDDLSCTECAVVSSSRSGFQQHYATVHEILITWLCSNCREKQFELVRSISSHLTKCLRRRPAASQPPRATSSGAIAKARLPATCSEQSGPEDEVEQIDTISASIDSHGRWTESELRALANLEATMMHLPFINQELAKRFTTRSLMAIRMQRHQQRYKDILQVALRDRPAANSSAVVGVACQDYSLQATNALQIEAPELLSLRDQESETVALPRNGSYLSEEQIEGFPDVSGIGLPAGSADGASGVPAVAADPLDLPCPITTQEEADGLSTAISSPCSTTSPAIDLSDDISQLAGLIAREQTTHSSSALYGVLGDIPAWEPPGYANTIMQVRELSTPEDRLSVDNNYRGISGVDGRSGGEAAAAGSAGAPVAGACGGPPLVASGELGFIDPLLINRLISDPVSAEDLKEILNKFGVTMESPRGRRPPARVTPRRAEPANRSERKRLRFNEHQRLYRLGPKVLLHQLMSQVEDGASSLSLRDIHSFFDPLLSGSTVRPQVVMSSTSKTTVEVSLFELEDVRVALAGMDRKAAAGTDRVSVNDLMAVDSRILLHIMNNFFVYRAIPEDLKSSKTVFIPKKTAPKSASDVRPIPMSSMLCRLYSRLLLRRLSAENSFHPLQGGFQDDRGTRTNLLTLQAIMKILKKKKSLYAVSLDVRKAFDCVSHQAIAAAAPGRGIPEHYIEVLKDLYSGCSTTFYWNRGTDGRRVPVRQGIKQGDPLSPYLFNAVLDPLLQTINGSGLGLQIEGRHAAAMAFADDVMLFSSSLEGLKALIGQTEEYLGQAGLVPNPEKSQYFGWKYDGRTKWFSYDITPIVIGGRLVHKKGKDNPITYLGIDIYVNRPSRVRDCLTEKMIDLICSAAKAFSKN
ncbi:uncharacterized protein LOC135372324 [Ornithodoros turicata]|uniref:uncharacterized protein LOC135372324 n=1 Tax=Ornithodoros turicata TaxID=34597 RepID=UPI0031394914